MSMHSSSGWVQGQGNACAGFPSQHCAAAGGESQNVGDLERWASIGAGTALLLSGITLGKGKGLLMSVLGGALMYRGVTGHCYLFEALGIDSAEHNDATAIPAGQGVKFEKTIVVHRSPEDLFRFWRHPENLPTVMKHVKEVRADGDRRSHWTAEGIGGQTVEWDAEIFNERENELIAWRSLPGGAVDTAGSVHFKAFPEGNGTAVTVSIKYNPPGGKLGASLASMLGAGVEQKIAEDLHRFKRTMEAGDAAMAPPAEFPLPHRPK